MQINSEHFSIPSFPDTSFPMMRPPLPNPRLMVIMVITMFSIYCSPFKVLASESSRQVCWMKKIAMKKISRSAVGNDHSRPSSPKNIGSRKNDWKAYPKDDLASQGDGSKGKCLAKGLQINERTLVQRCQRHQAQVNSKTLHSKVRIVCTLICCAKQHGNL